MQSKTTRAFRTISEASDELDLQPHVLRFWESKFPQIKPIKRGGGRRFYRPDDIEFLRGIKTLLHDEKHPIKDVQKLIRVKGAGRITELGRSVEKAARDADISDTDLVPKRIKKTSSKKVQAAPDMGAPKIVAPDPVTSAPVTSEPLASAPILPVTPVPAAQPAIISAPEPVIAPISAAPIAPIAPVLAPQGLTSQQRDNLEAALARLKVLRAQWQDFKDARAESL